MIAWICLSLLGFVGFEAKGGVDKRQRADVVWLIRILYAGIPSCLLLLSIVPLISYRIDRTTHAK